MTSGGPPRERAAAALDAVRSHLGPGLALAQKLAGHGAIEVSADGVEVTLSDGRRVLDLGSYGVSLLGHRPPEVVEAVARQLASLPTSSRVLANEAAPGLARALAARFAGSGLDRVWLGLNGSDAVEVALKLARAATGRRLVLAAEGGYHGKTMGALAVTWPERYRAPFDGLLPGAAHLPLQPEAVATATEPPAALIVEPVQGEGGVRVLDPDLLRRWSDDVHAAGGFVIADEIQTGLHRCGPFSLAVELGLRPDAVLLGKALGGGVMPASAVVGGPALFRPLLDDPFLHSATFSGHPLSCAAAMAALEVLDRLAPRGPALAARLEAALTRAVGDHPGVLTGVSGRGLMWGLHCVDDEAAGHLLLELLDGGMLLSPCLGRPEVLRLLPSLATTDAQLDRALSIVDDACRSAAKARST